MPVIRVVTDIAALRTVCFDLARSVDAHIESTRDTGERAVAGVTSGLLGLGDEVTWRARHFGISQELTSRITAFERPLHFRDVMVRGAFRRFVHDHHFEMLHTGTRMVDVVDYSAPLGASEVAHRLCRDGLTPVVSYQVGDVRHGTSMSS